MSDTTNKVKQIFACAVLLLFGGYATWKGTENLAIVCLLLFCAVLFRHRLIRAFDAGLDLLANARRAKVGGMELEIEKRLADFSAELLKTSAWAQVLVSQLSQEDVGLMLSLANCNRLQAVDALKNRYRVLRERGLLEHDQPTMSDSTPVWLSPPRPPIGQASPPSRALANRRSVGPAQATAGGRVKFSGKPVGTGPAYLSGLDARGYYLGLIDHWRSSWRVGNACSRGACLIELSPCIEEGNMDHPIYRVTAIDLMGGYKLRISFDDDSIREVDLEPILAGEIYRPLRDPAVFASVEIDPEVHTLVWPNGADFDPAILHDWPRHEASMRELAKRWAMAEV